MWRQTAGGVFYLFACKHAARKEQNGAQGLEGRSTKDVEHALDPFRLWFRMQDRSWIALGQKQKKQKREIVVEDEDFKIKFVSLK